MGWLFKYTRSERALVELYSDSLVGMGIPRPDAKSTAQDWVDGAIRDAKSAGTYDLPAGIGSNVLQSTDPAVLEQLVRIRAEGVQDNDIAWWWNFSDVERRVLKHKDAHMRTMSFLQALDEGKSERQAADRVRRLWTIFGDDPEDRDSEDRPLPDELRLRVQKWERLKNRSARLFEAEREEYSSLNAFVRSEIRNGKI